MGGVSNRLPRQQSKERGAFWEFVSDASAAPNAGEARAAQVRVKRVL